MAKQTPETPVTSELPYEITQTRDQMTVAADGRLVPEKVIYFRTFLGDTGHVEILKADFSVEAVRALIEPEVLQLLELRGYK